MTSQRSSAAVTFSCILSPSQSLIFTTHCGGRQSLRTGHREAQFPVRLSVQLVSPQETGAWVGRVREQRPTVMQDGNETTSRGQQQTGL